MPHSGLLPKAKAVAARKDYGSGCPQPLTRLAEIYTPDRVDLATSTLSGWLGATAAPLTLLDDFLRREVMAGSDAFDDGRKNYLFAGSASLG
ncbi:hypothetical protein MSPGM_12120 [Methylorubrum sp. GM97]|nr:hypothetical protein MSPGM_12120 [Methylorubrum sp. GM97]